MKLLAALAAGAACAAPPMLGSGLVAPQPQEPIFAVTAYDRETTLPDMSSDVALALAQTRDGYLWVGTEGGLIRFDGVRVTSYRSANTPGLPDNVIRCLCEDSEGTLWIGTDRGLSYLRDGLIRRLAGIDAPVADLAAGPGGRLWIGTLGAGLLERRNGRLISHADEPALKGRPKVLRLYAAPSGALWIGFRPRGAAIFDGAAFRTFAGIPNSLGVINRFFESGDGSTWIATSKGLVRLKNGVLDQIGSAQGVDNDSVTSLLADRAGRLWLAARGLYRSTDATARSFLRVRLPADVGICRTLLGDREGNLWVGTSGSGFLQLRETAFGLVPTPAGIPQEGVRSVSRGPDGSLWAALVPTGLERIAPDGAASAVPLGNGADAEVWSVLAASDGSVWIGTLGSLAVLRNGSLTRFPETSEIVSLYEDRAGAVWIATRGQGILRWARGAIQFMAGTVGDEDTLATVFADDGTGGLFIGVEHGLLRYHPGSPLERVEPGAALSNFDVRAVLQDKDGALWLGTKRAGLVLRKNGRWYNPDAFKEPFGDFVSAIFEDAQGRLWLGTPKGIAWAFKRDLLAIAEGATHEGGLHWAASDGGIQSATVGYGTQPVMAPAPGGALVVATRAGLVRVQPGSLAVNQLAPIPLIERIVADGFERPAGGRLALPAQTQSLEIDYTAPSFVRAAGVTFRYQLVGHDQHPIDAGSRRAAYYASLAPGRYQFRVFAANSDGIWSASPAEIQLVQRPAYYQTAWFYAAAAAGLAAAVLGGYFWRTHALRRENERLERSVAERTGQLVQARKMEAVGQLAGGVAHDFNNILTSILMQLGMLRSDAGADNEARATLDELEREALRAAALTRQLLAFSRRQVMQKTTFDLNGMLGQLLGMLRRLLGENIALTFQDGAPLWVEADMGMIEQVVTNLCINARDAMTPGGGTLTIETALLRFDAADLRSHPEAKPGHFARLSVRDTGAGMDDATLQHIFEPFFTTKAAGKGTGLGLATVYGITTQHQGWIEVGSKPGAGTTFRVFLPALPEGTAALQKDRQAEAPAGGTETILLVEDEELVRSVAARSLARCGYRVIQAADGKQALETWKRHASEIDLLFSDVVMPGSLSGIELAERLRRDRADLRVVLTSGYSVDLGKSGVSSQSAFTYLPKPYEIRALASAVRSCLDKPD